MNPPRGGAGASTKVGELRPSQLLFAFGVGATVDLPNISAMVMGLDDWDTANSVQISEERLLAAVREQLGAQVERLLSPPQSPRNSGFCEPLRRRRQRWRSRRALPTVDALPVLPTPRTAEV